MPGLVPRIHVPGKLHRIACAERDDAIREADLDGARYKNAEALVRLVQAGVTVSLFPQDVIEKLFVAAEGYYKDVMGTNANFARIYAAQKEFRDRNYLHHQYADFQYDAMMLRLRKSM